MIETTPFDTVARGSVEILMNGLWQSAIAVAVAMALVRLLPRLSAAAKCAIWSTALVSLVAIPAASALARIALRPGPPTPAANVVSSGFSVGGHGIDESIVSEPVSATAVDTARPVLEVPAGVWPIWVFVALIAVAGVRVVRVAIGAAKIVRMRGRARPLDAARIQRMHGWRRSVGSGRSARLASSPDARVPMVLGVLRPLIAIPDDLLGRLTDGELDHVVLHELAHVRRRDDWSKLLQSLVEALCFFNPAAGWLTRRIDAEREVACDDWVLAVTQERRRYAKCLLKLAGFCVAGNTVPAPGAVGRKSLISERIELVMETNRNAQPRSSIILRVAVYAALVIATVVCLVSRPAVALTTIPLHDSSPAGDPRDAAPLSGPEPAALASRGAHNSTDRALRLETQAAILRDNPAGEDESIRRASVEALGARAGTVLVIEPQSGRVLAAVNQEWAFRRGFPAASTIKLVTAAAALDNGVLDPDARVLAMKQRVNLDAALAASNNEYFQMVGERVGFDRFIGVARTFGLGEPTGTNYGGEFAGQVPTDKDDAAGHVFGTGQDFEVTAAQLGSFVAAIANGGTLYAPRRPVDGAFAPMVRRHVGVSDETLHRLIPGMVDAVTKGTGSRAARADFAIAGKTGTADGPDSGTGLFVSFAPVDHPSFVVVVVLRGSGVRGADAAAVAGRVYDTLKAEPAL